MSLTNRLSRRGNPIREFFEERLPNLKGVQARWRESGLPQIVPQPYGGSPGTIGTAFDCRVRYLFDASTSPTDFMAT